MTVSRDEEPSFSDPEDFVDDITDNELISDILEMVPNEAVGVENVIIVDNLPIVPPEKKTKLYNAISKIVDKVGAIKSNYFPDEPTGQTKGYMFLEFENKDIAQSALIAINGYRLDRQHTLIANVFSDVEKYQNVDEHFVKPEPQPYRDPGNLYSWLLQPDAFDQLVTVSRDEMVCVYQNGRKSLSKLMEKRRWTETDYVIWSPTGKYLGTVHQKGVALWGAEDFHQVARFAHNNCKTLEFSPCERFIMTFRRPQSAQEELASVIVWEIRDQTNRRQFKSEGYTESSGFKWSNGGNFVARCLPDQSKIAVYDSKTFTLLDKRPIDLPHVRELEWNPQHDQLACWCSEAAGAQTPARILIYAIPSKQELRSVNVFTSMGCSLFWHPDGTYMAARVEKYSKVKKDGSQTKYTGLSQNLHIFWAREKGVPVELLELKGPMNALGWEPQGGNRLAISVGEMESEVLVYRVAQTKIEHFLTLGQSQIRFRCNGIYWSPAGNVFVLTSKEGNMEFYDSNEQQTMSADAKQNKPAYYEWDPTGRFLMSASWIQKNAIENGLNIWSATGRKVCDLKRDGLTFCAWRPRPPSLLSPELQQDIKKNIKKWGKKFEEEDRRNRTKASKEQLEVRRAKMDEYHKWRKYLQEQRNELLQELEQEVYRIATLQTADREQLLGTHQCVEETHEILDTVEEEPAQ